MTQESLINNLLDNLDIIIIQTDSDFRISIWNREAELFFHITKSQVLGKSLEELSISWDFNAIRPYFSQQLLTEKLPDIPVSVGKELKILGTRILSSSNNNSLSGYIFLGRDLTQQRSIEQKLKNDRKMKTIGELSSGIAHEINTPAQFIQSNLEFIQKEFPQIMNRVPKEVIQDCEEIQYLSEEIPNAISQSLQGMKTITSITSSMRNYAHPAENRPRLFDLNYVIEESITISKNEWKYVSDLQFNKNENLPQILGYPSEMHQVFINLIVNASHAIDEKRLQGIYEKGKIIIEIKVIDNCFRISVSDNGKGIQEHIREHIFEPFFTTKERGKGSGQGLSIVKNIIEQRHGGSIQLDSREDEGTTFTMLIPAERKDH